MKKVKSPYIVHLIDVLIDVGINYIFLIMNYEENGNIEDFISNNPDISDY